MITHAGMELYLTVHNPTIKLEIEVRRPHDASNYVWLDLSVSEARALARELSDKADALEEKFASD